MYYFTFLLEDSLLILFIQFSFFYEKILNLCFHIKQLKILTVEELKWNILNFHWYKKNTLFTTLII